LTHIDGEAKMRKAVFFEKQSGGAIVKKAAFLLLCGVLTAGALYAQEERQVTGDDDLVQEKGPWAGTWVHPDADITKYSKLYIWEGLFEFREGGAKSSGTTAQSLRGDQTGPYYVDDESKEKFKQIVSDAIVAELNRSKLFEVVETVGPGTLLVRGGVLDIVSDVPPDATRRGNVYLAAVGSGVIFFELIDAETGVIQARVAERRTIQPQSRMHSVNTVPANANSVWMDVERWAREQAQQLRKELEKAKKKAE
jgi:hypothetical protein